MMEANYNKEQKRINFFEERAINNFKQNIKDDKKMNQMKKLLKNYLKMKFIQALDLKVQKHLAKKKNELKLLQNKSKREEET